MARIDRAYYVSRLEEASSSRIDLERIVGELNDDLGIEPDRYWADLNKYLNAIESVKRFKGALVALCEELVDMLVNTMEAE